LTRRAPARKGEVRSMPLSWVLTLLPEDDAAWPLPGGREGQGWFLRQVAALDVHLAESLHRPSGRRPYTLSGLMDEAWRPLSPRTPPRAVAFMRVTALRADLEALLRTRLLPLWRMGGLRLRLGRKGFRLAAVATTPEEHPWAGEATWEELFAQGRAAQQPLVRLLFASPTAFRAQGSDIPLPLPEHMVRSWALAWNTWAPAAFHLPPTGIEDLGRWVRVQRLWGVHTRHWPRPASKGGGSVGFMGEVDLRLLPPHRGLRSPMPKCGRRSICWPGLPITQAPATTPPSAWVRPPAGTNRLPPDHPNCLG